MKIPAAIVFFLFSVLHVSLAQRTSSNLQMFPKTIQDVWEENRMVGIEELKVWKFKYRFGKILKDSTLYEHVKYDSSGFEKIKTFYKYRNNGWCHTEYKIENNLIVRSNNSCSFGKKTNYNPHTSYVYNDQNKLEFIISNSIYHQNDTTNQYTYNTQGQLVSNSFRPKGRYRYDDSGKFIGFYYDNRPSYTLDYDSNGNIIRENIGIISDSTSIYKIEYQYNSDNQKIKSTFLEYDEEKFIYKVQESCFYFYEDQFLKTETCTGNRYLKDSTIEYEYNEKGLLTSFTEKNKRGKPKRTMKYYRKP